MGTWISCPPEADAARFHLTPQGSVLIAPQMLGQPIHDNG